MKLKYVYISLLFLKLGYSKTLLPFPKNGIWVQKQYIMIIPKGMPNGYYLTTYKANGDTIIRNKTYSKVYESSIWVEVDSQGKPKCNNLKYSLNATLFCAIRDSLSFWNIDRGNKDHTLYDFKIETNPKFTDLNGSTISGGYFKENQIDSILIDGIYRKKIIVRPSRFGEKELVWIEGIGANFGVFINPLQNMSESDFELLSFSEGSKLIYGQEQPQFPVCNCPTTSIVNQISIKEHIFPNPLVSGNSLFIQNIDSTANYIFELYDSSGRLIIKNENFINQLEIKFPNGMYHYRLLKNNKIIGSHKIIIQ